MSPSYSHHSLWPCACRRYLSFLEQATSRRNVGLSEGTSLFLFPHGICAPPGFKYFVHRLVSPYLAIVLTFIYGISVLELHVDLSEAFDCAREIFFTVDSNTLALERLLWEVGHCLSVIANSEEPLDSVDIQAIASTLHRLFVVPLSSLDCHGENGMCCTKHSQTR